jgi:hypothetical protein
MAFGNTIKRFGRYSSLVGSVTGGISVSILCNRVPVCGFTHSSKMRWEITIPGRWYLVFITQNKIPNETEH